MMRLLLAALMLWVLWVPANAEVGIASVYSGKAREGGSRTSTGERVDRSALTAAHRTLPFGTRVTVINRRNHRSVVVRINDRGPFKRGRIIDLTPGAARQIALGGLGSVRVELASR